MKRNAFLASTYALVAIGVMAFGCSSTSNSGTGGTPGSAGGTGTAGSTGTGGHLNGQGGTSASQGGSNGQGGAHADAGQDGPVACNPAPDDGAQCSNNPPCNKNCGVNIMALSTTRAQKTCTCSTTWTCGACSYPMDVDLSCLRLPTTPVVCPHDAADGGTALIKSGVTPCTPPNSEVCGSVCGTATAGTFSYQDSSGVGKVGYCACISGAYQCASAAEWPMP